MDSVKPRVILQFGKHTIKAGLAGDYLPKVMIFSPFMRLCRSSKLVTMTLSKEEWVMHLQPILQKIYYQKLKVTPAHHSVLIIEHEFTPSSLREAIAAVLFDELSVPSIFYMSEMVTPLYLTGVGTGLVIDIGFYSTRILPVSYEALIRDAYQEVNIGSYDANKKLKEYLDDRELKETDIDNIKCEACYVRCYKSCNNFDLYSENKVAYIGDNDKQIEIAPDVRWKTPEVLFEVSVTGESLIDACVKSIKMCSPELRGNILQNIVLCGGGSQTKGFLFRFAYEFQNKIKQELPKLTDNIKFFDSVCPIICRQWVGGSLCSYTINLPSQSDYEIEGTERRQGKRLPDWIMEPLLNITEQLMFTEKF